MNINSRTENNSIRDNLSKIWRSIPLFIRTVMILTTILYILNLFFPYISLYLSNIPYYTILNIHLWRLISTIFITTEIINIILSLLFWVKYASELESSMGTIKYFLIFLMNSLSIQILYSLISCLIAFLINNKKYLLAKINNKNQVNNSGLWPYIICELTLLSLSNPNSPMKIIFFPCQIKAKYYPFILFAIFSIMNSFAIDLEVLSGIIYALFYNFVIKKAIKISNPFVLKIEKLSCFKCIAKMDGFISVDTLENKFVSTVNNINNKIRKIAVNQSNKGFTPYKGEGIAVGGNYGVMTTDDYSGVNQNTSTVIQKSQNESLDVKITS